MWSARTNIVRCKQANCELCICVCMCRVTLVPSQCFPVTDLILNQHPHHSLISTAPLPAPDYKLLQHKITAKQHCPSAADNTHSRLFEGKQVGHSYARSALLDGCNRPMRTQWIRDCQTHGRPYQTHANIAYDHVPPSQQAQLQAYMESIPHAHARYHRDRVMVESSDLEEQKEN